MISSNKRVLVVASTHPVKLAAARNAFAQVFMPEFGGFFNQVKQWFKDTFDPEELKIIRVVVPSEVSEQPMSSEETEQGARSRLLAVKQQYPDAEAWVAIEGGVVLANNSVIQTSCVAVAHRDCPEIFAVEAPKFTIPSKTAALVREGVELEAANTRIFGKTKQRRVGGTAGIITSQLVTRYDLYYTPLLIAFSQIKNYHLYQS